MLGIKQAGGHHSLAPAGWGLSLNSAGNGVGVREGRTTLPTSVLGLAGPKAGEIKNFSLSPSQL